jgi:CheY-like chemotaxis protein
MKQKILLADDSPTIRRLVAQTFVDGKFEVVAVSNGEAAIKALDEVRPAIVLADIYMPGKNGYEVCTYVRNHATFGGTPVVLLVGAFDAFDEQVAKRSGATANITKPFEPGALIELVRSLVPEREEVEEAPAIEEVEEAAAVPDVEAAPGIKDVTHVAEPEPVERRQAAVEEKPAPRAPAPIKPVPEATRAEVSPPPAAKAEPATESAGSEDLLGLETLFKDEPEAEAVAGAISDEDIDRIADRVIQRLTTQVIESIAWDIVPDITEKIVREELKRIDES